jgi:hypothetical protein
LPFPKLTAFDTSKNGAGRDSLSPQKGLTLLTLSAVGWFQQIHIPQSQSKV